MSKIILSVNFEYNPAFSFVNVFIGGLSVSVSCFLMIHSKRFGTLDIGLSFLSALALGLTLKNLLNSKTFSNRLLCFLLTLLV